MIFSRRYGGKITDLKNGNGDCHKSIQADIGDLPPS